MTESAPEPGTTITRLNAGQPRHTAAPPLADHAVGARDVPLDALSEHEPYSYTAIVEIPVDFDDGYRIHPALQAEVTGALAGRGPLVSQGPRCVRVLFGVEGDTMEDAQPYASRIARWVIPHLGLDGHSPSRIEIRSPESFEEGAPVLVGLNEAATILGVSRQRATQIAAQAAFPRPIQRLRATPVWLESDVRRFAQNRRVVVAR